MHIVHTYIYCIKNKSIFNMTMHITKFMYNIILETIKYYIIRLKPSVFNNPAPHKLKLVMRIVKVFRHTYLNVVLLFCDCGAT